ncbi:hypothetical protein MFRU_017g00700 [Monilinia fructicola]|nr:hypothetical protein MFRU_017g00700 [Monilinia fructicola]
MDPVSALALSKSVTTILGFLGKLIKELIALQTNYRRATARVRSFIGQLSTIKLALIKVSNWINTDLQASADEELVSGLKISLDSFQPIICLLNQLVTDLNRNSRDELTFKGKAKYLWNSDGIDTLQKSLDMQVNALNLLLTALNCPSSYDRNQLLRRRESRTTFRSLENNRDSLMTIATTRASLDSTSNLSNESDNELSTTGHITVEKSFLMTITVETPIPVSQSIDDTSKSSKALQNANSRTVWRPWEKDRLSDKNTNSFVQSSQDHTDTPHTSRAILFGCSNSGKTTLKNSIHIFSHGVSVDEQLAYKETIRSNIVDCIANVLEEMNRHKVPSFWAEKYGLYDLESASHVNLSKINSQVIRSSWCDRGFRTAFDSWSSNLSLKESTRYYFHCMDRILSSTYMPNTEDILRSFTKTTGMDTTTIMCHGKRIEVQDVGGRRSERKKWTHCQSGNGPSVVIFTVSMSDFHHPLSEDDRAFQLIEDLMVYGSMRKARHWAGSKHVLLFTKLDEFVKNMWTPVFQASFREHFPEFRGDYRNIEEIKYCFESRFRKVVQKEGQEIEIVVLFGDLVDTSATATTTKMVLDVIFKHVLGDGFGIAIG